MLSGKLFQMGAKKMVLTGNLSLISCISDLQKGAMFNALPLNTLLVAIIALLIITDKLSL